MGIASSKRSNGALSGMRGVVVGAGLGVLAVKKGVPLVQNKIGPRVRSAMLKYAISHAADPSRQAPSAGQAVGS